MRSLSVFLLLVAAVATAAEKPVKVATVEGVTEYRLGNGARVLLYPEQSRDTITINMTVLVGSRHEGYGETGMAHLLEHMVFKGTPTFPDVPKALRDRGGQLQRHHECRPHQLLRNDAATDDNLEFGIKLEADRLVNSFVKREDLVSEMTVVRNEFERGENSPQCVLSAAHRGGRLRMAQLRQVDDRQPLRHRTRADRQSAGLLQQVLPAR